MRRPVDAERIRAFMRALGAEADRPGRVYLTGGATAVLLGWRETTIDIDLKFAQDETDVEAMLSRGLVDRAVLRRLFDEIEPVLFRFPAIDARAYRRAVEERTADD